MEAIGWKLTNS